jgi:hypothetical protein
MKTDNDMKLNFYSDYTIESKFLTKFIKDYIARPENKGRHIFTLDVDQRMDTLLFTIWRIPSRKIELSNSIGSIRFEDKIILLFSPFHKVLKAKIDSDFNKEVCNLFQTELDNFKGRRQELLMWQLKVPYHSDTFLIERKFNRIINTTKPPIPDSIKVDIQYQAD